MMMMMMIGNDDGTDNDGVRGCECVGGMFYKQLIVDTSVDTQVDLGLSGNGSFFRSKSLKCVPLEWLYYGHH